MATATRCRFAPSPTGFFHIGSARTALFNWLFARHTVGAFVLRIEDTDKERNEERYVQLIYDSLRWLGMDWDEGPGIGGGFGPYRQSERDGIYREHLQRLLDSGRAYHKDGAVYFRLLGERFEHYDEHRKKTVTKVRNTPAVIDDVIRGRVERLEDEDFVIVRSDGNPVFHFVNVVDDITMGITHVIRGEDHLSNTSKHVELFKAFGVPLPVYAHIPLILKSDGPGKMSKRDKGALIEEYQRRHFVSEAVRNYLCLLGWSPKDNREKMPIADIIAAFELSMVLKHNAKFDEKKMAHMNQLYLAELPQDQWERGALSSLAEAGSPHASCAADFVAAVLRLCREKLTSIEQVPGFTGYFWTENYPVDPAAQAKISGKHDVKARLGEILPALEAAADFSAPALETLVNELAARHALKGGEYIHTTRLAVSGTNVGPSFYGLLAVLGRERTIARIRRFLGSA
jgi:glutamyl-tRNA synthetase